MIQQTIPTANLRDFLDGDEAARKKFAKTIGDALVDVGFFALEGHGVDTAVVEKAYQTAEQFFKLPVEKKENYALKGKGGQRGYTGFGKEHAKDSKAGDLKEFWHVGQFLPAGHPLHAEYPENLWPSEIEGFRPVMSELYAQLETCALHLLDACSLYLGLEEKYLRKTADLGNSILRVIHYPPVAPDADPAAVRAAAHEDINLITLLCESTAEGLQLLKRDGSWLPIRAIKGQIIVDSGDMIQNLTNGYFKATTHRVVNPDNDRERRFSMPFFVHPRSEVSLNPLPSCVEKMGEKKFPNITAGEYLNQRLKEIGLKG